MKIDTLKVFAQVTLKTDSDDAILLHDMFLKGYKVEGLVEQFMWMPFVVVDEIEEGSVTTFELQMRCRKENGNG